MPRTSVCFAVTEVLGTAPFGGIATATTHAALVLAGAGYDVELFYCGSDAGMEPAWARRYADAGIHIRRLDRSTPVGPSPVADSYRLYLQLRDHAADVVVFQDWMGLGFCSMQAKRAGELASSRLVHIVHGPSDWLREANLEQRLDGHDLVTAWMERRSAELADDVVGPSAYLLDWMAAQGWRLPAGCHVIPYFTEGHVADLERPLPADPPPQPLRELVFFGRLEERKGVRVFAEALDRLGPDVLGGLTVTFLGRAEPLSEDDVRRMLTADVRHHVKVRFESGLDQAGARAYLAGPGRIALIPSLLDNSPNVIYECIEDRIPFLASSTGGNAELVHPDDRVATLFDPEAGALAAALRRVIDAGVVPKPARPAFDGAASLRAWAPVLAPPQPAAGAARPGADSGVALVITHHDQGRHLPEAVASAVAQTHERLDIVIVDDGSTDPESLAALDVVEDKDWGRPVRVLREPNRYLGAARNTGARATDAEFVAFCDDDDVLDPEFVAVLVDTAVRTGAAAVVSALRNREVGEDGELRDGLVDPVWTFLDGATELGTIWNTFGGAGMLVRRDVLLDAEGFHEQAGVGHEDWDLLARLALDGHDVLSVPRALYDYRIRPGSMIRTTSQHRNVGRVNSSYAARLPDPVRGWPALVRGQHLVIEHQRAELERLQGEVDSLAIELERRTRFLEVLRDRGLGVDG